MPNYGRSGRCLTCKRRHVKCDEARPACSPCRRLGLDCGGYVKTYTFRTENHKFSTRFEEQDACIRPSAAAQEPSRSLLTETDLAVPFFLLHYAGMGRRLTVARGFYETLIPTYSSQPGDSPLSLAVRVVAGRVFSLWRYKDATQDRSQAAQYTHAIKSLRSALERVEHRRRPATTLAILALHLYESISAVFDARQATPIHHRGALSLLPARAIDSLEDLTSTYVKRFVAHTEISSALRQKRPLHPATYAYMDGPSSMPGNFSSVLDSIGASITTLQAAYVSVLSQQHTSGPPSEQQCRAWITEAKRLSLLLQVWAEDMPSFWRPLRLTSGYDFDLSISAYRFTCDIYSSCQMATLWNLWRFHRLLLLKIIVVATHISNTSWDKVVGDDHVVPTDMESFIQTDSIRELVDDICYSIPFYLGNRTNPSNLNDFADLKLFFPSYHSLPPEDTRIVERHRDGDDDALSKDEHHRHIVAYGAWHAVSPLSNLLTLFSDDGGGPFVASSLRPGQQDWIREQFLRISVVLRLPTAGPSGRFISWEQSPALHGGAKPADGAAESLARQVRQGTMFMSGP